MQQGSRESVPSASSFTGTVGEDPTIPPRPPKWAFPAGCHRVASPREVRLCLPTLMLPPPRVPTPRQHARGQGGVTQGGRHRSPHAPLPRKCPHSNQGSPSLTWGLRATGPGGLPVRGERDPGLPGQSLEGSRGGPAPLGEDFLSGPKGLMGKGIVLAKFALSSPAGQGFLDKGQSWTPTAPRPLPGAFPPFRSLPSGSLPVHLALKPFPSLPPAALRCGSALP